MKKRKTLFLFSLIFIFILTILISAQMEDSLKWQSIAFGQSVDLNFSSTILPEKVGVNRAIPEVPGTIKGKIVLESRGGKIAAAHDGITFYYTELDPTKYNFILEADILIEQFGPETDAMPNNQTACGLMVRDVNGLPRKEPMVFGYEELPASSNFAGIALFSEKKTEVDVVAINRNGIFKPWGNPDSTLTRKTIKEAIPISKPFKLKLERTDNSFIVTYSDIDGKETIKEEMKDIADIVQIIEKNKMYVGFFAARNAKMVVSNAKIKLIPANTIPSKPYQPKPFDHNVEFESSDGSSTTDYTLVVRSGYSGKVTITKNDKPFTSGDLKAGEFTKYQTKLTQENTKFEAIFTPSEGPKIDQIRKTLYVTKRSFKGNILIASPDGKASGKGTLASPVDIPTAIRFIQNGGIIYLREGNYQEINIPRTYSGIEGKIKKIMPYNNEKVVVNGFNLQASYWHIYGIEVAKSKSYGFRIQGSNNIIENCVSHDNQNTGFHMDSYSRIHSLRASNNLYLNCTSYDNIDPAMMNADGFAAKSAIGKGNIYRGCIAHNNADDGWDFFTNVQNGPHEPILIENCIAYGNGKTTKGKTGGGAIGNGFKLGGEGQPVAHIVKNSIAFANNMDGFTCNFNPGAIVLENCTSFNNVRCNYIFRMNPYIKPSGIFRNNISFRTDEIKKVDDFIEGSIKENNIFFYGKNEIVKENDFVTLKIPEKYERDKNGNIIWGDFLRLTKESALNKTGKDNKYIGALPAIK